MLCLLFDAPSPTPIQNNDRCTFIDVCILIFVILDSRLETKTAKNTLGKKEMMEADTLIFFS